VRSTWGPSGCSTERAGRKSERISPTAHYTGYVWVRQGLSHPALATWQGRALFHAVEPLVQLAKVATWDMTLEKLLLVRHRVLDHLLERAIAEGRVHQVVEVAAGMSGRGLRLLARHPHLRYVEADLPHMAERKRQALAHAGLTDPRHEVVAVDALLDSGPLALGTVLAERLDPALGVAIITEGLVNYFDQATVEAMWARFARVLGGFRHGLYLSDLHVQADTASLPVVSAFLVALSLFTRGRSHLHYASAGEAQAALTAAGLSDVRLHSPSAFASALPLPVARRHDIVRIVEARVA
jgi:O-methyltransferase involved in polyketide biosynthesis